MRPGPAESGRWPVAALRWGIAGCLVAALHGGGGWWVATHPVASAPPDSVQGIPLELEPVAIPQNAPEPNSTAAAGDAPNPQTAAAPVEPQPEATPAPEPAPPEPPPQAEPSPSDPPPMPEPPPPDPAPPPPDPAPPVVEPPPEPELPPPPEPRPVPLPQKSTTSDAVLAPAVQAKPRPPKPDPRVLAREAERRKAATQRREQQRAVRDAARVEALAARARAQQARPAGGRALEGAAPSSVASGAAIATWRGAVQAHLRASTPPGNGASGTARVAFSVDRGGRVVSAALAGSSGNPAVDAAAVALVRRASPVPAPPPELGSLVNVTVPVLFR